MNRDFARTDLPLEATLWNGYAVFYGSLEKLAPYIEMYNKVLDALPQRLGRVLDVGCGPGYFLEQLSREGRSDEIVGVDFSGPMIHRAEKRVPSGRFVIADLNKPLPFDDEYFDAVVSVNMIYAASSPEFTFGEMIRVTKDGGRILLVTPKASAGWMPIVREHFRKRSLSRALKDAVLISPNLYFNFRLSRMAGKKRLIFFSEREIKELVKSDDVESTYADQAWFVRISV